MFFVLFSYDGQTCFVKLSADGSICYVTDHQEAELFPTYGAANATLGVVRSKWNEEGLVCHIK